MPLMQVIVLNANDHGEGLILPTISPLHAISHFVIGRMRASQLVQSLQLLCSIPTCTAGGTFAIYSLLCRFARINPVGNVEAGDQALRRYTSSQGRMMSPSGR